MRGIPSLVLFVLVALCLAGCSHAPAAGCPSVSAASAACAAGGMDRLLHLRALLGVAETDAGPRLVEAELLQSDGREARLTIGYLLPSGKREEIAALPGELAAAVAEAVGGGASLSEALAPGQLRPWLPAGLTPLQDPDPCELPAPRGRRGWPLAEATPALQGFSLILAPEKGATIAILQDEDGGGTLEITRFLEPAVELARLEGSLAVIATCAAEGPISISDRHPIALEAQAATLLARSAKAALDRGALEAAAATLARASHLGVGVPLLWFQQARLLARTGGDRAALLHTLGRAIEVEPALYRMEARTCADFDPLREDEDFVALTRPRPLPGTNRAGARPAPIATPPEEPAPAPIEPEEQAPEKPEEEPAPIELPPTG